MNVTGIIFFLAIIVGMIAITYSAAKRTVNTKQFFVAGNQLTGVQNGLAIAGDYMSAASFLGITGAIVLYGYDGFYYSLGFLISFLVVLLIVAEPIRNLGKYTFADAIAARFEEKRVRGMIALNTISISTIYMIAQLVGAGALFHLLIGIHYSTAILITGFLMTVFVVFGGMIATSWVQIVKSIILLSGTLLVSLIVLARFDWDIWMMFKQVTVMSSLGDQFLEPGNQFSNPLDMISLHLALILGTAGLPHIVIRFFTVKDAILARKSVVTAIVFIGSFYFMTIFLGFGAAAFINREELVAADLGGNLAAPLLAEALGGEFLMALISAIAFATILAVVTGLVLSASSSFAHDFYNHLLRRGAANEKEQMIVAKCSAIGVGAVSMLLAIGAKSINVAFLVGLAFAVSASANLPLILLTLFWKKFTSTGAIVGMFTGLLSSLVLVLISPNVMNPVDGLILAEAIFPLKNPGILSIPLGFIGAYVGTILSTHKKNEEKFEQMLIQAHTGLIVKSVDK